MLEYHPMIALWEYKIHYIVYGIYTYGGAPYMFLILRPSKEINFHAGNQRLEEETS